VVTAGIGSVMHHAHNSAAADTVPLGVAGTEGVSEHQAPWQRRGTCGNSMGCHGSVPRDAVSKLKSPRKDGTNDAPRSAREVTRCEHPAHADVGTSASEARSAKNTPAAIHAHRLEKASLLIRNGPYTNRIIRFRARP
jgi:hypothetical protein